MDFSSLISFTRLSDLSHQLSTTLLDHTLVDNLDQHRLLIQRQRLDLFQNLLETGR